MAKKKTAAEKTQPQAAPAATDPIVSPEVMAQFVAWQEITMVYALCIGGFSNDKNQEDIVGRSKAEAKTLRDRSGIVAETQDMDFARHADCVMRTLVRFSQITGLFPANVIMTHDQMMIEHQAAMSRAAAALNESLPPVPSQAVFGLGLPPTAPGGKTPKN